MRVVEVGPRDGLQNESKILPVEVKLELIRKLADSGLKTIEVGSFVSPKWIPQMADTSELMRRLTELSSSVKFPVLIPNLKGLEHALAVKSSNLTEISVFTAASETFSKKNINMTVPESLKCIEELVKKAKEHNLAVRGYVSTVIGCPYEGKVDVLKVRDVCKELVRIGCYEISLGDTIGVGSPNSIKNMLQVLLKDIPAEKLAVHFHDTYGQALVNIFVSLDHGIHVIDSAVAGLGGCPYAPGSSGNVSTEDVVNMLHELGYDTGVNFGKLAEAGNYISGVLDRPNRSRAGSAFISRNIN